MYPAIALPFHPIPSPPTSRSTLPPPPYIAHCYPQPPLLITAGEENQHHPPDHHLYHHNDLNVFDEMRVLENQGEGMSQPL